MSEGGLPSTLLAQEFCRQISIDCGVEGTSARSQDRLFLPVCKAVALPHPLQALKETESFPPLHKFSLCFTSRHAVYFFLKYIFPLVSSHPGWESFQYLCAVGSKTASLTDSLISSQLLVPPTISTIFPPKEEGISPLLSHLSTQFPCLTSLFIFTAAGGATFPVLEAQKCLLPFKATAIAIYRLLPIEEKIVKDFFEELFKKEKSTKCRFVFFCNSGIIVEETINHLMKYFKINHPKNLPKFIFFSIYGKSSEKLILKWNLIDRIIS